MAKPKIDKKAGRTPILRMGPGKARRFLLRGESYCRFGLPDYVEFNGVRQDVGKFLTTHALSSASNKAHQHSRVNHTILDNEDGRYAWRPMDLIHPALYVDLVHLITKKSNWRRLRRRFEVLNRERRIASDARKAEG